MEKNVFVLLFLLTIHHLFGQDLMKIEIDTLNTIELNSRLVLNDKIIYSNEDMNLEIFFSKDDIIDEINIKIKESLEDFDFYGRYNTDLLNINKKLLGIIEIKNKIYHNNLKIFELENLKNLVANLTNRKKVRIFLNKKEIKRITKIQVYEEHDTGSSLRINYMYKNVLVLDILNYIIQE